MALNAYYSKRKIALVAVNGNPLAQKVAQEMREQGMSDITVLDVPKAYLDYYTLAQLQPEYVLFIYEGTKCKVKTTKIEGIAGDRLGHMVRRNTEASKEAQGYYKHQLRMIGLEPMMLGAETIGFRDVKDIPWFYTNSAPMLHLYLPDVAGVDKAITEAVKDYFKAVGKRQSEAEKKAEKESKNCCGLKSAVDRD